MKQDIETLLAEKQKLDDYAELTNNLTSYDQWLIEAVAVLLRIALEQEIANASVPQT